jgi:transcriptional antiterminator Rof (Rho-off)
LSLSFGQIECLHYHSLIFICLHYFIISLEF